MSSAEAELKKEFELERMILFSDAVFAIVITLLIIEIKFPELHKGASPLQLIHEFKPTIVRFLGFILTFFFIGMMWSRHLRMFKYLQTYNSGVIFRNLVLLFFIVCFPFSASGITEHIRPGFYLPFCIYIINIACVAASFFWLTNYIFSSKRPHLSVPGLEAEKKYMVLQSKFAMIVLSATTIIVLLLSIFLPVYTLAGFYAAPVLIAFTRRHLKKHKPAKNIGIVQTEPLQAQVEDAPGTIS